MAADVEAPACGLDECPLASVAAALGNVHRGLADVHQDLSEVHQDNTDSHAALTGLLTRCVEAIERVATVVESNGFHKRNVKRNWLRRLTGR